MASHVIGLSILTALYIGWVYIGHVATHKWALFFLNHKEMKWEHVFEGWVGLIVLSNICESFVFDVVFLLTTSLVFAIIYFITAARERLTRKSEHKNAGYQSLPQ